MLFVTSFAFAGLTSCDDDDNKYDNVTPPTVEVAPSSVSGVVTSKQGAKLADVTVSMGNATATTDAEGVYKFESVAAGKQAIKAVAKGFFAAEGTVEVLNNGKTQNVVWNATLTPQTEQKVEVSDAEDTKMEVVTVAVKNNDKAEVKVEAEVLAAAVESELDEVEVVLAPVYDAAQAVTVSRAEDPTLLVGTSLSCSDPKASLKKEVVLTFFVDESLKGATAMKFVDGGWVPAKSEVKAGGEVVVYADQFTSYGLFLNISFSYKKNEAQSVLNKDFNNLYGASDMKVGSVDYTYKSGMDVEVGGNTLTALLIEKLVALHGATSHTFTGSYPLNVTLPVGTMLSIVGSQESSTVTASAAGTSVSGTIYGDVTFTVTTTNRQHSGGTN